MRIVFTKRWSTLLLLLALLAVTHYSALAQYKWNLLSTPQQKNGMHAIAVSASGQYVVAVGQFTSILESNDHGATFTSSPLVMPVTFCQSLFSPQKVPLLLMTTAQYIAENLGWRMDLSAAFHPETPFGPSNILAEIPFSSVPPMAIFTKVQM